MIYLEYRGMLCDDLRCHVSRHLRRWTKRDTLGKRPLICRDMEDHEICQKATHSRAE